MELWSINDEVASVLVQSSIENGSVDMWSTSRLSFEPKNAMLTARNYLRSVLSKLRASANTILNATYTSAVTSFVDVENVLIYNVGPAHFDASCKNGLRFERKFAEPQLGPTETVGWKHHHRYSLINRRPESAVNVLGDHQLEFHLPALTPTLKPHDYWWAARQRLSEIDQAFPQLVGPFSMDVTARGPAEIKNPAALVKPLFDGIISALHHDPTIAESDLVAVLIGARINESPATIAQLLRESRYALFGTRKIVSPYRDFVKWNPADDLCVVGQLGVQMVRSACWSIGVRIAPNSAS